MKKIILYILISAAIQFANAQSDSIQNKKNKIGFELAYNQTYLKDIAFSPLNYSGGGSLISFNYRRNLNENKSLLTADFNLFATGLNTSASELLSYNQLWGNIEIGYLRKTKIILDPKKSLFLGLSYNSEISYLNWQGQSQSYHATHGVTVKGIFQYHISSKQLVQTMLTVPVAQIIVRPPYNGFDKKSEEIFDESIIRFVFNGKLGSLNKYLGIFWETKYIIQLSKRWDLDFSYTLLYKRTFEDNKLIQLNNVFSATINYKF
jgi:hypothetical protein